MRKLKDTKNWKKWKITPPFWMEKLCMLKISILSKGICTFYAILMRSLMLPPPKLSLET